MTISGKSIQPQPARTGQQTKVQKKARRLGRLHFAAGLWRGTLVSTLCSPAIVDAYQDGFDRARSRAQLRYERET